MGMGLGLASPAPPPNQSNDQSFAECLLGASVSAEETQRGTNQGPGFKGTCFLVGR